MANPVILSRDANGRYYHQELLTGGQTSEPVIPPPAYPVDEGYKPISVAVFPGAGASARIEVSLSPLANVQNDTANWTPWGAGDVTANTTDVIQSSVTAIRCVSTGGSTTWEVCA